jgi:hypothetical protein
MLVPPGPLREYSRLSSRSRSRSIVLLLLIALLLPTRFLIPLRGWVYLVLRSFALASLCYNYYHISLVLPSASRSSGYVPVAIIIPE